MSLCLSEETLKAVGPFHLVSMPGEVKYPTQGVMCNLSWTPHSSLEKDRSVNHSCLEHCRLGCGDDAMNTIRMETLEEGRPIVGSMWPKNKLESQGEVYKTVVRPAMMYGAETRAVKKTHDTKLGVA